MRHGGSASFLGAGVQRVTVAHVLGWGVGTHGVLWGKAASPNKLEQPFFPESNPSFSFMVDSAFLSLPKDDDQRLTAILKSRIRAKLWGGVPNLKQLHVHNFDNVSSSLVLHSYCYTYSPYTPQFPKLWGLWCSPTLHFPELRKDLWCSQRHI